MVGNLMYVLMLAGRWDEAARLADDVLESAAGEATLDTSLLRFRKAFLEALRGETRKRGAQFAYCESWKDAEDVQASAMSSSGQGALALAAGEYRIALEAATQAIEGALTAGLPLAHEVVRLSFPDAVDAAVAMGELEAVDRLLELFANRPLGEIPQFLEGSATRAKALVAIAGPRGRSGGPSHRHRDGLPWSRLPDLARACAARPGGMACPPGQARRVDTDRRASGGRIRTVGAGSDARPGTGTARHSGCRLGPGQPIGEPETPCRPSMAAANGPSEAFGVNQVA